jgi:hypothetical protein
MQVFFAAKLGVLEFQTRSMFLVAGDMTMRALFEIISISE